MPSVSQSVLVGASLAEVWDRYFDERRWRSWVDGFEAPIEVSRDYPEVGESLRWRSIPAGRGEVRERVLEHEHRRRHAVAFSDPAMEGTLTTTFAIEGAGTRVAQTLDYRLVARGPIARIGGLFFVKGQVRASMERTLTALRREVEEAAEPPA